MKVEWAFCAGLAGLAAGVFLALAFAPQSGKDTRSLVKQKTRESLDQLSASGKTIGAQLQDLGGKGKDLLARGREQVTDTLEVAKQAVS
jgi:gas vesicle protein